MLAMPVFQFVSNNYAFGELVIHTYFISHNLRLHINEPTIKLNVDLLSIIIELQMSFHLRERIKCSLPYDRVLSAWTERK